MLKAWNSRSNTGDRQVEYIEGTGSQWFDTGYIGGSGTGFEIDFSLSEPQIDKGMFGCLSEPRIMIITAGAFLRVDIGYGSTIRYAPDDTNRRTIKYDPFEDSVHDSILGLVGWDDHRYPITEKCKDSLSVFTLKNNGNIVPSRITKMRLYSLKIFQDGDTVLDIVPMSDGSSGYAYDKISKNSFFSRSSEGFIAGAPV